MPTKRGTHRTIGNPSHACTTKSIVWISQLLRSPQTYHPWMLGKRASPICGLLRQNAMAHILPHVHHTDIQIRAHLSHRRDPGFTSIVNKEEKMVSTEEKSFSQKSKHILTKPNCQNLLMKQGTMHVKSPMGIKQREVYCLLCLPHFLCT